MNKQSLAECSSEAILTCHQYLAEIIGDFPASKVLEAAIEELPESSPLRAIKFGDGVGEKELGTLFSDAVSELNGPQRRTLGQFFDGRFQNFGSGKVADDFGQILMAG